MYWETGFDEILLRSCRLIFIHIHPVNFLRGNLYYLSIAKEQVTEIRS